MPFWRKKQPQNKPQNQGQPAEGKLSSNLEENMRKLRETFGDSSDVVIRRFELVHGTRHLAAFYINGLVEKDAIDQLMSHIMAFDTIREGVEHPTSVQAIFKFIREKALFIGEEVLVDGWEDLIKNLLNGRTIILLDGLNQAVGCNTCGGKMRAVTEASTQVAIRGAKESFTEMLITNVSLVRRKIHNPNLWMEMHEVGSVSRTDVAIMYMHGIADEQSVQAVRDKIKGIDIASILESGQVEQLIEDHSYTPFPTVFNTERPDSVASNLMEGRIAIIVDGTPFVLIAPTHFFMFFHAVEDHYQRFDVSTLVRLLRYICLIVSLFGPAIFVAALTFHQEMIPTPLLINLASQREGVPFPAFVEAFLMEGTFEIIREAGIRLPTPIGQTVSIIGGLVLGQAAVQAGIVSPAMVIVVSITGISSFTTPAFNMALSVRLLRFVIMFIAAFMGLYGITIASFILVAHLCSLKSLGFPYMAPLAPFSLEGQKDAIIRLPIQFLNKRPRQWFRKEKDGAAADGKPQNSNQPNSKQPKNK